MIYQQLKDIQIQKIYIKNNNEKFVFINSWNDY